VNAQVAGLINMPRLSDDTALIGALLVALFAFILGGRALLAYQALTRRAIAARQSTIRLVAGQASLPASFARVRGQAAELSAGVERTLWALPRFDVRLADAQQTLADDRQLLDELRRDGGRPIRGTVERIRGTLTFLGSASELRRKFRG
jgi:hypothetical protein